jgi:hypothetical protein
MPLIPMLPGSTPIPEPIHPAGYVDPSLWSGELYWAMVILFGSILFTMVILHIVIMLWGNPILKAKSAHTSGKALVQHFENSRIAVLKLASIGGGAIRHERIEDGTLITIPKGINNLQGLALVNSWNLTGISLPIFLMGAITKLRSIGITTRALLEGTTERTYKDSTGNEIPVLDLHANLITDSYDFNDFNDIIKKSKEPNLIPLEIEHTNDFIEAMNQHYTESDITKEVKSYLLTNPDNFGRMIVFTGIGILITAIASYFLIGSIK